MINYFLIFGVGVLVVLTGRLARRTYVLGKWPTVSGSFVKKEAASPLKEWYNLKGAETMVSDRYLDVEFSYIVDGKTYTSKNLYPAGFVVTFETVSGATKALAALPANPVVHYNPSNPGEAYILLPKLLPYSFFFASLVFGAYILVKFLF